MLLPYFSFACSVGKFAGEWSEWEDAINMTEEV
jgi:hypothetical protein